MTSITSQTGPKKWQMNFNVNKCKRFHIGQTNHHNKYTIAGIDLVESDQERDLGIIVDNKLKFHIQTAHIVNKGFSILGIIKKSFENLDEHTVPILYKTLVRPILRIHVTSPILEERISAITLTQQRKQWLSVELNRWRSERIHYYFFNNKNRTLIIIM